MFSMLCEVKPAVKAEGEPLCTGDVCVGQVPADVYDATTITRDDHE